MSKSATRNPSVARSMESLASTSRSPRFDPLTASGAASAMASTYSSARAASRVGGTASFTSPQRAASSPETALPASRTSAARFGPTDSTSRSMFSKLMTTPRRPEGIPIRASVAARARSQATAI